MKKTTYMILALILISTLLVFPSCGNSANTGESKTSVPASVQETAAKETKTPETKVPETKAPEKKPLSLDDLLKKRYGIEEAIKFFGIPDKIEDFRRNGEKVGDRLEYYDKFSFMGININRMTFVTAKFSTFSQSDETEYNLYLFFDKVSKSKFEDIIKKISSVSETLDYSDIYRWGKFRINSGITIYYDGIGEENFANETQEEIEIINYKIGKFY